MIADGGMPRIAADAVLRPRLLDSLDRLLPLTVLRAPRGFGKTTLAAQWFSRIDDTTRAWVSVERTGTSVEEFWIEVARALGLSDDAKHPRERVRDLLASPGRPVVLVVDDVDRVEGGDVGEELLGYLRRYPRLHLVATLRTDALDHRGWLDLDGQVLGPDDLGFTPDETAAVLDTLGAPSDDLEVAAAEVGGWPIAVRCFALVRRAQEPGHGAVEAALRTVRDELSATILGMTEGVAGGDLVLPTAVIGDFSLSELGLLLNLADPQHAVDQLSELGLVSIGSGSSARHSWPGLVRDAVLERAREDEPARLRRIRQDLARRYADLEEDGRSIELARDAEDWEWVRTHIENRWTFVYLRHFELLGELVRTAPPGALGDGVIMRAMRAVFLPDVFRIEDLTATIPVDPDEIRQVVDATEPLTLYDRMTTVVAVLRLLGEVEASTAAAAKARKVIPVCFERRPESLVAPGASMSLQCGLAALHAGDLALAVADMERAHHYGAHSELGHILRDSAAKLALVHGIRGDHPLSQRWVGRAEASPLPHTWATPFITAALAAGKVLNAVAALDRKGAVDLATDIAILHPREELWALIAVARAKVTLLWGPAATGLRELDAAQGAGIPPVSRFTGDLVRAARVDLAMRLGLGSRCAALLDDAASTSAVLQVRRARLALLAGDPAAAVALGRAAASSPDATPGTDLEALVVEAVALQRLGDPNAPRKLGEALAIAGRRLDAFALVPRAELIELARQAPGADGVLHDPRLVALGDVFPERLRVITLTERERVVLRHLAAGMTLPVIAHRETVSINTVKSQVRSIYQKLGAGDRDQALQVATQEGLV